MKTVIYWRTANPETIRRIRNPRVLRAMHVTHTPIDNQQ